VDDVNIPWPRCSWLDDVTIELEPFVATVGPPPGSTMAHVYERPLEYTIAVAAVVAWLCGCELVVSKGGSPYHLSGPFAGATEAELRASFEQVLGRATPAEPPDPTDP
jgi:hypothetical protein